MLPTVSLSHDGREPMSAPAFTPQLVSPPPHAPSIEPVSGARAEYLQRAAPYELKPSGVLRRGELTVDTELYAASVGGRALELSPRQVELLAVFLAAPHRVWSREQLHWICWGDVSPSRRVDVQLCRIRTKVGLDLFRNIRDRGWTLQLEA